MKKMSSLVSILLTLFTFTHLKAEDWLTYQHDNIRSGITKEKLEIPLKKIWIYSSKHPPKPAWPPPAKADYWHHLLNPRARVTYDRAFHVVSMGDCVYFCSSADDKVYCLDALTGKERWTFFTEAPVRLAPTLWNGKVYFGSDDGYVYCLRAKDGKLIWKYRASPEVRKIPGNGRIISTWPVRSGVIVEDGIAYFCAGIFPKEGVYVCTLDALDGTEVWKTQQNISSQGYLLASKQRLYFPMGRVAPAVVSRNKGELLGILSCQRAEGGTYALLAGDSLISGTGTQLTAFHKEENDRIATFKGYRVIVDEDASYLFSESKLSAIDRTVRESVIEKYNFFEDTKEMLADKLAEMRAERNKLSGDKRDDLDKEIDDTVQKISNLDKKMEGLKGSEYKWHQSCDKIYYSMILAGDTLFMGSDGIVEAVRTSDGKQIWNSKVDGRAYGLAVAKGKLLVSTDTGNIYCFGTDSSSEVRQVRASDNSRFLGGRFFSPREA